jgi:hypothetical protein
MAGDFKEVQKRHNRLILLILVAREGIEPPTRGFSAFLRA